jgi:hypothetical protein
MGIHGACTPSRRFTIYRDFIPFFILEHLTFCIGLVKKIVFLGPFLNQIGLEGGLKRITLQVF